VGLQLSEVWGGKVVDQKSAYRFRGGATGVEPATLA